MLLPPRSAGEHSWSIFHEDNDDDDNGGDDDDDIDGSVMTSMEHKDLPRSAETIG